MFSEDYLKWEKRFFLFLLAMVILASITIIVVGCSTYSHEPNCICDCDDNHFECGSEIQHKRMEIK